MKQNCEPAMWVPGRLDIFDPQAVIVARTQGETRIQTSYRETPDGPIVTGKRYLCAKPRAFTDMNYGAFFDDHPDRPAWEGVNADNARAIYEQRLANWKHYAGLYRQERETFDPAPYRALLPEGEPTREQRDAYTEEQRHASWVLREFERENQSVLVQNFDSLFLDPLVHDASWFVHFSSVCRYGISHPRKTEWFWSATIPGGGTNRSSGYVEGFADSEEETIDMVRQRTLETYPRGIAWCREDRLAKRRYKTAHARTTKHKDWTKSPDVVGTEWEDRRAVWNYDSGYFDGYSGPATWTPVPIVNITAKYVYILNKYVCQFLDWRGTAVQLDQFTRDSYYRLSRADLESEGYVLHREWYERYYAEPDLSEGEWKWEDGRYVYVRRIVDPVRADRARAKQLEAEIRECRKAMQREHPDRGGNVDKFMAARADLERMRASLKAVQPVAA